MSFFILIFFFLFLVINLKFKFLSSGGEKALSIILVLYLFEILIRFLYLPPNLKNPLYLTYGIIFVAGLINDVVIGIPMGLSSFCYLLICIVTAYLRNITLSPNFINDWITLLFTLLLVNSIEVIFLDLIFSITVNYTKYFVNTGFTFLFYPIFLVIFNKLERRIRVGKND